MKYSADTVLRQKARGMGLSVVVRVEPTATGLKLQTAQLSGQAWQAPPVAVALGLKNSFDLHSFLQYPLKLEYPLFKSQATQMTSLIVVGGVVVVELVEVEVEFLESPRRAPEAVVEEITFLSTSLHSRQPSGHLRPAGTQRGGEVLASS